MPSNVYLDLTREFNVGALRVVVCSGQAVVLHRLAVASKDGDWMVRERDKDLEHVLSVLEGHGAHYRFGAPLDSRWLAGGWSAHFEFRTKDSRVRTDFFSRPPRLTAADIERIWREQATRQLPFFDVVDLALVKRTDREKDWAVIGELARLMSSDRERALHSRSARDLLALAERDPDLVQRLVVERPVLSHVTSGRDALEQALDSERRQHMRANEERLRRYTSAATAWLAEWPRLAERIDGLPLRRAHRALAERACDILPFAPSDPA